MPTIDLTEFVVLENIPVLETGVEYPASTGPFSVTSSMIDEAIRFANDDPHGHAPRIKIAHADNPINGDLQQLFDELNEGRDASKPSLGTIINLRKGNAGQTLVGDWYGLPAWLAAILETAYPARSIEGGSWTNSANQKSYDFKVEAVSLLGVVGPGCTSLADLQELFSKDGPKVSVIEMSKPTAKLEGGSKRMPVVAQVNVEDIRRSFYDEFAQGDRYWWFDRELLADPWEMIVQDMDSGQLYRVPFSVDEDEHGDAAVEWGEPSPIKVQYVPDTGAEENVQASRLIAPQLERAGVVLAVNTSSPRAGERKRKEGATPKMAIDIPTLRAATGLSAEDLPDDATEDQINEALASKSEAEAEEEQNPEAEPEAEGTPKEEGEPAVAASGTVVDVETWKQVQEDARLGREARKQQVEAHRTAFVKAAIKDRKIPPSREQHYMELHTRDPKGTEEFLNSLEKDAVPGPELGSSAASDATDLRTGQGTGLLPELEQKGA